MNAKSNLNLACGRAFKLLSLLVFGVIAAGLLGVMAESRSAARDSVAATIPDYALEWDQPAHRLRYFASDLQHGAHWSFDSDSCRGDADPLLPPGRWRVVSDATAAGAPPRVVLAALDGDAATHPLVACGTHGSAAAIAVPAHTLGWLAARNGGVVHVRQ